MGRRLHDWDAIQAYHDQGHGFVQCARHFGFCHTAWIKAIGNGRLRVAATRFRDRRRRYEWAEVQAYYDEGNSYVTCRERFGFSAKAWDGAVKRGEIVTRGHTKTVESVLRSRSSSWAKRQKLLREGLIENVCSRCGLSQWRGKPLVIHIDHINGERLDWRLENIRMLCPNCHSQTSTFSGRNSKKRNQVIGRII